MVDIYILSKTVLTELEDEPQYVSKEIRSDLKFGSKDEFDLKSKHVFLAYKVEESLRSVYKDLPPGRWIVDFDGSDLCVLDAVRSVTDTEIILESKKMSIEFVPKMPILIYQIDQLVCQPIKFNQIKKVSRTAVYVTHSGFVADQQGRLHLKTEPDCIAVYKDNEIAGSEIAKRTSSYASSSVHLVVRADDQSRSENNTNKNLSGYIDDENFSKYFGDEPKVCTINGTKTRYHLSSELKDIQELLNSDYSFMRVFERCILIIVHPSPDDVQQSFGFASSYIGKDLIYAPFQKMVTKVSSMDSTKLAVRMVHIVQSSGMGKTRVCFQLLEDIGRGIYCVYRKSGSTGYPPTTPWLARLFTQYNECTTNEESVRVCLLFIRSIVEHLFDQSNAATTNNSFLHYKGITDGVMKLFQGKADSSSLEAQISEGFSEISLGVDDLVKEIKDRVRKSPVFPIVFDECHELLISPPNNPDVISLYRAIRRALVSLRGTGIVGLFLGTKASLGDFTLNWMADPSLRVPSIKMIVPPYLLSDSLDLHLNRKFVVNYKNSNQITTIEGRRFYRSKALEDIALCCGRPLWRCYETFCRAFDVAMDKISSDPKLIDLAALLVRISAVVSPQDKLAHDLVLSGMATLVYIDTNRGTCLIYYCPEPVLSNAARIHMSDDSNFLRGMEQFLRCLNSGVFKNTGEAGEILGRLFALRAFDKALIKYEDDQESESDHEDAVEVELEESEDPRHFFQDSEDPLIPKHGLTTVAKYLMNLSGLDKDVIVQKFGLSNEVMSGFITCCQFVPIERGFKIDQLFLMNGFIRSVGFSLFKNAPGADAVIPVLRADNKMSCIVLQFKNYSHSTGTFPYDSENVSKKLLYNKMDFLNFDGCDDFPAVLDKDDFVRVVVEYRENIPSGRSSEKLHDWIDLTTSRGKKSVLWLNGLDALDHLISFDKNSRVVENSSSIHSQIRVILDQILSADRNFFNGIQFLDDKKSSFKRQTGRIGADTLFTVVSPCANTGYLSLFGSQGKKHYAEERQEMLKKFQKLKIPEAAFDFRKDFVFTPIDDKRTVESVSDAEHVNEREESHHKEEDEKAVENPVIIDASNKRRRTLLKIKK